MPEKKRRPAKKRAFASKSPYFLQPARQGAVTVLRRPAGNRIDPKLCGTMNTRATALALVKQLERAESVVKDLFLEATDDGIEALEAVLEACRQSVLKRTDLVDTADSTLPQSGSPRNGRGRRRRPGQRKSAPPSREEGAEGPSAA